MTDSPNLLSLKAFTDNLAAAWSSNNPATLPPAYAPLVVRVRDNLPRLSWSHSSNAAFTEQLEFNQQCGFVRAVVAAQQLTLIAPPFYKLDLRWRLEPADTHPNDIALTYDASYMVRQTGLSWQILVEKTHNFFESYSTYSRLTAAAD